MRCFLFAAGALLTVSAWAHVDQILSLRPDGAISGLPTEYRETRLHIEYARAGEVRSMHFISGGRVTNVEPCVLATLSNASPQHLELNGSWYHDSSGLPHYIVVEFRAAGVSRGLKSVSGTAIMFSLSDARVLSAPPCKSPRRTQP